MSFLSAIKKHQRQHHIKKSTFWNVAKIVLAFVLVAFILSQTSLREVIELWHRISVTWLLYSVLCFFAITWTTARRYHILIDKKITFRQTLVLVIIQSVVGNLLATSAGVATYVTILRGKHKIQVSQSVISILLARFGDVLALLVALTLSSWILWPQIATLHWILILLIVGMVGLIITFLLIITLRKPAVSMLQRALRIVHLDRIGIVDGASRKLAALAEQEPGRIRALLGPFLGYSALTLILTFVFGYCNMRLFAVPVGSWPVLFIISLTQFIAMVPVQVFGGLGTYDVTSMYLYDLFGVSQSEIVPVIIGSRIYFYLLNLLLMLYLPIDSWLNRD